MQVRISWSTDSVAAIPLAAVQLRHTRRAGKYAVGTVELEAILPAGAAAAVQTEAILLPAANTVGRLMAATNVWISGSLSFGKAFNAGRI
jgi:hypothetical protein